jgi:hypothetical protein
MPNIKEFIEKLKSLVTDNPHILQVFLLADGSYTLNAYQWKGELYSRIDPAANVPNVKNADALQAKYKIVETMSREDILKAAEALEHPEEEEVEEVKQPDPLKTEVIVPDKSVEEKVADPEPAKIEEIAQTEEVKETPATEPAPAPETKVAEEEKVPEAEVKPEQATETTQN